MRPSSPRRYVVALCALALGAASAGAAAAPCPWDSTMVSADSKPLPASAFVGIDRRLTLRQIVDRLGPAQRDVGSGLHVLQWAVADGRRFSVSVADACSKPVAVGFLRHVKPPRPAPGAPPTR